MWSGPGAIAKSRAQLVRSCLVPAAANRRISRSVDGRPHDRQVPDRAVLEQRQHRLGVGRDLRFEAHQSKSGK